MPQGMPGYGWEQQQDGSSIARTELYDRACHDHSAGHAQSQLFQNVGEPAGLYINGINQAGQQAQMRSIDYAPWQSMTTPDGGYEYSEFSHYPLQAGSGLMQQQGGSSPLAVAGRHQTYELALNGQQYYGGHTNQ
jgi:hypothetical protein